MTCPFAVTVEHGDALADQLLASIRYLRGEIPCAL